jgi:uncharacterized protein (UPF0332 family)
MGADRDAAAHLAKAEEFLTVARAALALEQFNAAASTAVTAGINAKDVICLRLTGHTSKSDDHRQAAKELAHAGQTGKTLESTLDRLIALKPKSQYQPVQVTAAEARHAVDWAARMLAAAEQVMPRPG